ncbi:MAG: ABC transporter ATP-binding protein [Pigmentiphaga sp.]|uniref:ABC transporter ATP-binding protein n=1 Tax=Pigmentiphaga sp. TaxID=1977564 RepID=UPI0029A46770|nr:ABC transporter ATP-binding protein [Pigmentiphaga sp.]MDX3905923.1 ABC transporter ATP-binding protein [Pigmentiphaga sp.]
MAAATGLPAGSEAIVRVSHLTKIYPGDGRKGHDGVLAVDAVDLTVRRGELVVLLGPSGCGKTTLLRCIAGLEKPDGGEIQINGKTVFSSRHHVYVPPEHRHIGMMFQSYALWPHMTVFQNVAYPLTALDGYDKESIRARVADVLGRLGIVGMDHRYPGELSGGQQQRVALARALAGAPSVMLFDEPLSNIDAKVRRRLRRELRELKAQAGFSGIYVTHDQEEAMELADTLAVMESGRISQSASGRDVYEHPASIYVAEFVGEINRLQGRVETISGGEAVIATPLGKLPVSGVGLGARTGDDGWLTIRPEQVAVAPAGSPPSQPGPSFPGVVQDAIYFGARQELRLEVAGTPMTAWTTGRAWNQAAMRPGDAIDVTLPAASLRWFPA